MRFAKNWISQIRKGDVLRAPSGLLRVVRAVNHENQKTSVHFSIKHCSWTRRCYTVYFGADLKTMGYRPTGKRMRLRREIDAVIEADFGVTRPKLTCCDVEGIS